MGNSENKLQAEKEVVLARLRASKPNRRICFATSDGMQALDRNDLIKSVDNLDTIGKKYIEIQMNFARAMASGEIMKTGPKES